MPRVIEPAPPLEFRVRCPHCLTLVGYHRADVRPWPGGMQDVRDVITCPSAKCGQVITVP